MKYSDFLHNSMLVMVLQFGDIDYASAILNKKIVLMDQSGLNIAFQILW